MSGKSDEQQTKDEKTTGPEQLQQQPARPIIDDTCLASEAICGKRSAAEFISPEKPTDEEVRSASISQEEASTLQSLAAHDTRMNDGSGNVPPGSIASRSQSIADRRKGPFDE